MWHIVCVMKHGKITEEVWVVTKRRRRVWVSREFRIENRYVQWLKVCNRSSLLLCETSSTMEVVVVLHVDDFWFNTTIVTSIFCRVKNLEKLLPPLEVGGVCVALVWLPLGGPDDPQEPWGRVGSRSTPNLIMEIGPNFNQRIRSRSALTFLHALKTIFSWKLYKEKGY